LDYSYFSRQGKTHHNSGFAKKRVQWLIEHSTSYQHLWFIDNLELRIPLLRKAANRYLQAKLKQLQNIKLYTYEYE